MPRSLRAPPDARTFDFVAGVVMRISRWSARWMPSAVVSSAAPVVAGEEMSCVYISPSPFGSDVAVYIPSTLHPRTLECMSERRIRVPGAPDGDIGSRARIRSVELFTSRCSSRCSAYFTLPFFLHSPISSSTSLVQRLFRTWSKSNRPRVTSGFRLVAALRLLAGHLQKLQ
uniref:Uncharacterized protein n=1 Tax=Mycena chlorophos TaxID=658473 RepID=A0ABQ0LD02_MYCCL|nr:predicted protein [Mycena chlorophos]